MTQFKHLQYTIRDNYRLILLGILFLLFGLQAPRIIKSEYFGINTLVLHSVDTGSIYLLVLAAVRLVVMNTLRVLPIYLGALFLAEGFGMLKQGRAWWARLAVVLVVPIFYQFVFLLHGVTYDFGTPSVTMLLAILLLTKMKNMARSVAHKSIVIALLYFGVNWLDVVPLLSDYGFGGGPISHFIKDVASLNNAGDLFNLLGITFSIFCVSSAVLLACFLNLYTMALNDVEQSLEIERLNHQVAVQILENRSLREMRSLVHDLKTPLTSIQGLAGVISISQDIQMIAQHANYISSLVDKMNVMVNEMLNEDSTQVISAQELVQYAITYVPQLTNLHKFELDIKHDYYVKVNKIRIARALVNILQNAIEAVSTEQGYIKLSVAKKEKFINFIIVDNGPGFGGNIQDIWKIGYSQKNSSGLGLAFVRDIVAKYGGLVNAANCQQGGAQVIISLPEVE